MVTKDAFSIRMQLVSRTFINLQTKNTYDLKFVEVLLKVRIGKAARIIKKV
jgi:hypothetical protein